MRDKPTVTPVSVGSAQKGVGGGASTGRFVQK